LTQKTIFGTMIFIPMRQIVNTIRKAQLLLENLFHDVRLFTDFLWFYFKKKMHRAFFWFEKQKDILVKFLLMKRGRYNRPFLHLATMGVLGIGVLLGPFIADTYPIFSANAGAISKLPTTNSQEQAIEVDNNVFQTRESVKPRSQIMDYTVARGDTLSTIADKFGISADTIRWANSLTSDSVNEGDVLKILPVSGISYKVQSGDTVYSVAKKFGVDAQNIVNFPFNDYANPETFSLVAGQILIVPGGIQPSAQAAPQPAYYAKIPTNVVPSGGYSWPIFGIITQYPIWYHMAYDLAASVGTPIKSTKDGIVKEVVIGGWNYGYGTYVVVDHGDGYSSLYGHMSAVAVHVGQQVTGGVSVVGYIGLTGRTTGPHVHFEIRKNNITINPAIFVH